MSTLTYISPSDIKISEFEDGALATVKNEDYKITNFKVEQRIKKTTNDNKLQIGRFMNGESNISSLSIKYLLTLFTDKYDIGKDNNGNTYRKRYGYGFEFNLDINGIKSNIGVNFSIIAASAALRLATTQYEILAHGYKADGKVPPSGPYNIEVLKKIQLYIEDIKNSILASSMNKPYPIDIILPSNRKLESSDTNSIYFGVLKVREGKTLNDAIIDIRNKKLKINENVVQFMYNYFDVENAYIEPSDDQKRKADLWRQGKYNKIEQYSALDSESWVSIDPEVENGKFIALTNFENSNDYIPHPVPEDWESLPWATRTAHSESSLDFSSNLKLASIINTSVEFNTLTITDNYASFTDISKNGATGSKVIETRYGYGVRLILHISNIEFGTKIDFQSVGAASELNHANVEYEISGIGISNTEMFKLLPGPQDITQDTWSNITTVYNNIISKFENIDKDSLTPKPFMIKVNEPEKIDPTLNSQAIVFSYLKIEDRETLNDALNAGNLLRLNVEIIKDIYSKMKITDKPTREDSRIADKWLNP